MTQQNHQADASPQQSGDVQLHLLDSQDEVTLPSAENLAALIADAPPEVRERMAAYAKQRAQAERKSAPAPEAMRPR